MKRIIIYLLAAIFFPCVCLHASEADSIAAPKSSGFAHQIGVDIREAYAPNSKGAILSSPNPEKVSRLHTAFSANLKYSFSFTESTKLGRLYPGAYQGVGIGMTTFGDNRLTGTPINAYLFQGYPIVRFNDRLSVNYEWNFGLSCNWKPYSPSLRPVNQIVGSKVNAYMNLGFLLSYRVDQHWSLTAGVEATHFSNGNTSWPNPGVNTIGGRIGAIYRFNNSSEPQHKLTDFNFPEFKPHFSYDLIGYVAYRKRELMINGSHELLPGRFGIVGLNFAPMYNFNRFVRAGLSADLQYDESSNLIENWAEGSGSDIKFYRPSSFLKQTTGGLSVRGELVMPIFTINAGLGLNIIGPHDNGRFYQTLALKIHIASPLFLNIGYQLNSFKNPNNLMLGLGYTFHNKR